MALIEYATDEITEQVLAYCTCSGDGILLTENHGNDCDMWSVKDLLDKALAEQRERIAQAIETARDRSTGPTWPWFECAQIARETP